MSCLPVVYLGGGLCRVVPHALVLPTACRIGPCVGRTFPRVGPGKHAVFRRGNCDTATLDCQSFEVADGFVRSSTLTSPGCPFPLRFPLREPQDRLRTNGPPRPTPGIWFPCMPFRQGQHERTEELYFWFPSHCLPFHLILAAVPGICLSPGVFLRLGHSGTFVTFQVGYVERQIF